MTPDIPRAETVGSLLRPPELLQARHGFGGGHLGEDRLGELEDQAVRAAIRLQESAGLDVITDGEMRRGGWAVTSELLDGFELRPGGPGLKKMARRRGRYRPRYLRLQSVPDRGSPGPAARGGSPRAGFAEHGRQGGSPPFS